MITLRIEEETLRGRRAYRLRQTSGTPILPCSVLWLRAEEALSYARWKLGGPGGRIEHEGGPTEVAPAADHLAGFLAR